MAGDPQELHDVGEEEGLTLKPCPCCGNEAYFGTCENEDSSDYGGWFVECSNDRCRLTTPLVFPLGDDPRERLREIWNKRHNVKLTGNGAATQQDK